MTTFGFLHTAALHVAVFDRLLHDRSPTDRAVHRVDASLLTDAVDRGGVDDDLRTRIARHLSDLTDAGATGLLCTCSTVGAAAEEAGVALGLDVSRVDRPMARAAVAAGDRIAIVAALPSTLRPTRALLEQEAAAAGRTVHIVDAPCTDAWDLFRAGDLDGYVTTLATHVSAIDATVDVIVLAQASMAPVPDRVTLTSVLLSSPRLAVEHLVTR